MKKELLEKAKKMRYSGSSIREISEVLSISKSTASLWVRREKISVQGRKRLKNLSIIGGIKARQVLLKKQEEYSSNLNKSCLVLKEGSEYSINELKIFLALLYWGEGSKTKKSLSFTNSDPNMVSLYLGLIRKCFKIDEYKFSAWLYLHDYHNRPKVLKYWSEITGIDKKRIHIYNKKNTGIQKKDGYLGCVSIRYGDYKIFDEIIMIISRFSSLKI